LAIPEPIAKPPRAEQVYDEWNSREILTTKPPRAEQVLAALAGRHKPGQVVTLAMMMEAAGINQRSARRVRAWATSVGRWPYLDGRAAWPNWKGARSAGSGS
jgi:hypothetical protein